MTSEAASGFYQRGLIAGLPIEIPSKKPALRDAGACSAAVDLNSKVAALQPARAHVMLLHAWPTVALVHAAAVGGPQTPSAHSGDVSQSHQRFLKRQRFTLRVSSGDN